MTPSTDRAPARPRSNRGRRSAAGFAAAALAVVMVGSGCAALTGDTGSDELQEFLSTLERGDLAAAAALTTDPAAAEEALTASVAGLGYPTLATDTPDGDRRPDQDPVAVQFTWDLGDGEREAGTEGDGDGSIGDDDASTDPTGADGEADATAASRAVTTSGQAGTVKVDDQWKVQWEPTILDSRLATGGRLSYAELTRTSPTAPAPRSCSGRRSRR